MTAGALAFTARPLLTVPALTKLPAHGLVPYKYVILPHVFAADTWVEAVELRPSKGLIKLVASNGQEAQFDAHTGELLQVATSARQQSASVLGSAISHYRGAFLRDFQLRDCAAFDDWAAAQRQRREVREKRIKPLKIFTSQLLMLAVATVLLLFAPAWLGAWLLLAIGALSLFILAQHWILFHGGMEAELAYILLTDISDSQLADPAFVPRLGFFIANDLSSRALQILGEGMQNRLAYWGMSKSFSGFLPVTTRVWVPKRHRANAIPCVALQTHVNGELRQNASTADMIYTPLDMLRAARRTYPHLLLKKGDIFITGTPGGIALVTPRWKGRLAELFRFNRFTKLKFVLQSDNSNFLKSGDKVTVSGDWLGKVQSQIR